MNPTNVPPSESKETQQPLSDEMLATLEQRARWRISCLAFLVVGPLCTVLWMLFKQDILSSLPGSLQPFAELGSHPILPLGLCAAGAGFCLAKLWFPRGRLVDILAYAFLITFVILVVYGALFLVSGAILRALFVKPGQ